MLKRSVMVVLLSVSGVFAMRMPCAADDADVNTSGSSVTVIGTVDESGHGEGAVPPTNSQPGPASGAPGAPPSTSPTASGAGECVPGAQPFNCLDSAGPAPGPAPGPAAAPPPPPAPIVLAQQAATSVTVVTPEISLDPFYQLQDGRRGTLKNIETWLWIDKASWTALTPRVEVGPVWVQATITPETILVEPNDGVTESYSCEGPGTPIPSGTPVDEPSPTCSLRFLQETDGGTWPVAVRVSYAVTWTGFDGASTVGGSLPNLTSAPTTVPLAVLTAKPELIDPNHD